jgi:tRNA(fMet)-specific endonuclease VapC
MTHLLDTNICSAHMRHPAGLAHRFFQHAGNLAISTVVLSELYSGAYKHPQPPKLLLPIGDLLQEVTVLDFNSACAEEFGKLNGDLLKRGLVVSFPGLMIAATAKLHDLTLVTHNRSDFQPVPDIRLEDWLAP